MWRDEQDRSAVNLGELRAATAELPDDTPLRVRYEDYAVAEVAAIEHENGAVMVVAADPTMMSRSEIQFDPAGLDKQ